MTVDSALDLNQSASSKEFDGLGPDHISPSALLRTLLQFGCERRLHYAVFYRIDAMHAVLFTVPEIGWLVGELSAIRKLSVGNRLPCRTTEAPFTTRSAFGRSLLSQLRPPRLLSFRHPSPGRGGNLPVDRRYSARLCSGIGPNEFLEDGDGLVKEVEQF